MAERTLSGADFPPYPSNGKYYLQTEVDKIVGQLIAEKLPAHLANIVSLAMMLVSNQLSMTEIYNKTPPDQRERLTEFVRQRLSVYYDHILELVALLDTASNTTP